MQRRDLRRAGHSRAASRAAALTPVTEPLEYFRRTQTALGDRYRLERTVSATRELAMFEAWDQVLKRRVSLRVDLDPGTRGWFLREAEALGRLDHPAIRHVYDAGVIGDLAYRVGNWVEGESLQDGLRRGPRPIPVVHTLARDLLGALEHAHANVIIFRRVAPGSLLLSTTGRSTVTDLRFCSYTLSAIPSGILPTDLEYMAPEIRDGAIGDATSDVYNAGALLYAAITGQAPPPRPCRIEATD